MRLRHLILAGTILGSASVHAHAASKILFVLDSSNSMWGQVEGTAKMDTAKTALSKLISDLPGDTEVGLMVYGHRDKASCEDVEVVLPFGKANSASVATALSPLRPTGKTPIAYALAQAPAVFGKPDPDAANSVVLISDGVETCEGDPCAAAGTLANSNINVRVHVVGFDISDKDRAALECIAEKGKGQYFAANSTQGFSDAVAKAAVVAQAAPEPPPAKAEPARTIYFEDEFDGEDVGPDWSVINPNPDGYIVEDGQILIVNSGVQGFNKADTPNIIHLDKKPLPKGDWDLTAKVKLELQTGKDNFWLGLYKDEKNYMAIQFWSDVGYCSQIVLRLVKMANGEATQFDARAAGSKTCGFGKGDIKEVIEKLARDGLSLTLSKRGREYTATAILNGTLDDGKPRMVATEALTSLRLPGQPAIAAGLWNNANGEMLSYIDRVEIVAVE